MKNHMQKTVAGLEGHTAGKRTQKLNTSYLHVNNQPLGTTKKAGMKREHSPSDPYKRKAREKETIPGSYKNPLSPRGRASVSRYRLAGGAAEELIKILGAKPTESNRRLWAYYCYHHDIEIIFEKAYLYVSEYRQGEIRNPVTAFQHWLSRTYGKEAT